MAAKNGRLEEALTTLVQTQAAFAQSQATFAQTQVALLGRLAELERVTSERFARIELLLLEHTRILERLPEAVREKIGFKGDSA